MSYKKTIAVIGATSNVGTAIAKCLATTNNRLLLMADEGDQVELLVSEIKVFHLIMMRFAFLQLGAIILTCDFM